jgi:hypothetical protein
MASDLTIATGRGARLGELTRRARQLRLPWIPLTIVTILLVCSAFAPLLTPHDPTEISILDPRMPPERP